MEAGQVRVLAVAGDPGGANAVAPVLLALQNDARFCLKVLAYREAVLLWSRLGIPLARLERGMTQDQSLACLRESDTRLLVTGTSFNPEGIEKFFIAAARTVGVPSLSLLDFWSHYRLRFADSLGQLVFQPDRIAVMDERAKQEMIGEGFEPHRLVVTGHPAFDELQSLRIRFTAQERDRVRREIGVPAGSRLVVFVSQPLSSLFGESEDSTLFPGYTEHSVLQLLVGALDRLVVRLGCSVTLAIQLHPRDEATKYSGVRARYVQVMTPPQIGPHDAVMAADLVVGMNSMLLVQACYLGCVTISLQPGLRLRDALPMNQSGLSVRVYAERDIEPVLERFLLDEASRTSLLGQLERARPVPGATARVVQLIHDMLKRL